MMRYALVHYYAGEVLDEIQSMQQTIEDMSGSSYASRHRDPHLTVGAGVVLHDDTYQSFVDRCRIFAADRDAFVISSDGYDFVDDRHKGVGDGLSPYLIFLNIEKSQPLIDLLLAVQESVTYDQDLYYGTLFDDIADFQPHATLAFGDLSDQGYMACKEYFSDSNVSLSVVMDGFSLVQEQSDGSRKECEYFPFAS